MSDGAVDVVSPHYTFTEPAALAWRLMCAPYPHLEVQARTGWKAGRLDLPVDLLFVGTRTETRIPGDAIRPGCMLLHSHTDHPGAVPLVPSVADLDSALGVHARGAGFAIASPDASRCLIVVPPPARPPATVRHRTFRLSRTLWFTIHRLPTP